MRVLFLIVCLLAALYGGAQNTSWFYGSWYGETYFPNGPVTKRILVRLEITSLSGSRFTARLANFYPNDTTVRLERELSGSIENRAFLVNRSEQTYIRDPRTQNFWYDCTRCPTRSSFTIDKEKIEIRIVTVNCGDVCDGETVFRRDTSQLDPTQKAQLARWLGLPPGKPLAGSPAGGADSTGRTPAAARAKRVIKDSAAARSVAPGDTATVKRKLPLKDSLRAVPLPPRTPVTVKKKTVHRDSTGLTVLAADTAVAMSLPRKDSLPDALVSRATTLVNTYQVSAPHITIQLYDNAEIDGDIVSVYHNGKLIADHQSLTHKAVTFAIDASPSDPHHEFVMVAENLGLIPPNTALMRISAGQQKFELELSSDYDNNAKIAIDYTGD